MNKKQRPCNFYGLVYNIYLVMSINSTQELFASGKTVFTLNELALVWGVNNRATLLKKVNRWSKNGKLLKIRRGLYATTPDYSKYEVAQKILAPSYISLHTVLFMESVIFQHDPAIYSVSNLSRKFKVGEDAYYYQKIKDEVLYNKTGLLDKGGYWIACKERAFLDQLYLVPKYYFDNTEDMDWEKVFQILPIYGVTSLEKVVKNYAK